MPNLMYNDIVEYGGNAVMWKTDHSLIKAHMREIGAKFAGEMSGNMFIADRYYGFDDATYAALRLVEILSHSEAPMSGQLSTWPKTFSAPEVRLDCPVEFKTPVVFRAVGCFGAKFDAIDIDGVRAIFSDGWGLIRASDTQPVFWCCVLRLKQGRA